MKANIKLTVFMAIVLAMLPITAVSRDVIGINRYMTYDQIKEVFDYRFNGGTSSYQENRKQLIYTDVNFAGESFSMMITGFTNGHIDKACFFYICTTPEAAKRKREMINLRFNSEYGDCKSQIGGNGFKNYYYFTYDGEPIDYAVEISVKKYNGNYECVLMYDFSDYETDTDGI